MHAGLWGSRQREETKVQRRLRERAAQTLSAPPKSCNARGPRFDPGHFGNPGELAGRLEPIAGAEIGEHPGSAWRCANNVPAEDAIKG
eukprot:8648949-Pyramimonas_sp.AAC.1